VDELHQDRTGGLASPISARIYEGRVARIHPDGDPLQYDWGNEYRDAAGIQEIVDELKTLKPFTLLHPGGLVSHGVAADVVGQIIGARIDGNFVVAQILISDDRAIAAIAGGMHELSLGYTSRLDDKRYQRNIKIDHVALVPKARCGPTCALRADCITCNNRAISYNSNIVADSPLVGSQASSTNRHYLSANMFAAPDSEALPITDEGDVQNAMSSFAQMDFKGPAERKAAFHHLIARAHHLGISPAGFEAKCSGHLDHSHLDQGTIVMDELQKKLGESLAATATEKARADQLDVELKAVKASLTAVEIVATNAQAALVAEKALTEAANVRADQAKLDADVEVAKTKADAATTISAAVAQRVQLLTEANQVLGVKDADGKIIDRSAMDDQAIRLAVIKHVDNLEFPVDKDVVFVQGVYAGSLARAANAAASRVSVRQATVQVRATAARVAQPNNNAARDAEVAAQKAMQADQANRWRTKAN